MVVLYGGKSLYMPTIWDMTSSRGCSTLRVSTFIVSAYSSQCKVLVLRYLMVQLDLAKATGLWSSFKKRCLVVSINVTCATNLTHTAYVLRRQKSAPGIQHSGPVVLCRDLKLRRLPTVIERHASRPLQGAKVLLIPRVMKNPNHYAPI